MYGEPTEEKNQNGLQKYIYSDTYYQYYMNDDAEKYFSDIINKYLDDIVVKVSIGGSLFTSKRVKPNTSFSEYIRNNLFVDVCCFGKATYQQVDEHFRNVITNLKNQGLGGISIGYICSPEKQLESITNKYLLDIDISKVAKESKDFYIDRNSEIQEYSIHRW